MGEPLRALPVKLIIGLIAGDIPLLKKTERLLAGRFGAIDYASPLFDFDRTDYYAKEMGTALKRKFLSFKALLPAERLIKIKLATNALEKKIRPWSRRRVNIDPGYITLSKLVLASTKNFCHRIYIGGGIFEEITLMYKDKSFQPGPQTYPDYASQHHIAIFNSVRDIYRRQIEERYGLPALSRCV